ncbi:MAG: DedA family protein [bacterium]|jgi:membrane protein DedA with SNARE-associated domain
MAEQTIINLITDWGYWAVMAGMFLEGLTAPFPGAIVVLLAGTLAVKSHLSPLLIAIFATLGYLAGTLIPYYVAKSGGRKVVFKYGRYIALSPKTMDTAESWFNRYGNWVVCFSRPFFFGNYVSYLAGLASMGLYAFILYTFMGIFSWSIILSTVGYCGGEAVLAFW